MDVLSYPVLVDPARAVARWRLQRRRVGGRVVSLVISVLVWAVIWWLNQANLWPGKQIRMDGDLAELSVLGTTLRARPGDTAIEAGIITRSPGVHLNYAGDVYYCADQD